MQESRTPGNIKMIAHLKGKLIHKSPIHIIIDVNGVGYQVFVSLTTYYGLPGTGAEVSLGIHTHLREESLKLFGFLTPEEQEVFEKLISINKVGPKLALTILSGMAPEELLGAIMNHDVARLSAIPGIGKKTAERLALELKDKLSNMALETGAASESAPLKGAFSDALSALTNLGYKRSEAEKALNTLRGQNGTELSLEELIKESLSLLS